MSDDPIVELARRINASDSPKAVLYVSGGGTELFPMLLARGGGSATLLGARIPYDPNDFRVILGYDPGPLVDARAARGLAMAAFGHALSIRGDLPPEQVFGLGATSKLSRGDGEREGRSHEIHAAIQSSSRTESWSITLPHGHDRGWEERINALFLLNLVASRKGSGTIPLEHEGAEVLPEMIHSRGASGEPAMEDLRLGRRQWVALDSPRRPGPDAADGWTSPDQSPPKLLLPGSFRPVHAGHLAMAEVASRLAGEACGFEMSLFHPEKPPLDFLSIGSRLDGFEGRVARIYLTNAPTYLDKARLFPGCTFVVGHDTALRIVDPRYYGGTQPRNAMFDDLERLGARFFVFGRLAASGEFRDFSPDQFDQPVSDFLYRVATPIPGHHFRVDLSSSEIRRRSDRDYD